MHDNNQPLSFAFGTISQLAYIALALMMAALLFVAHSAPAQTFTVLHSFTAGGDGAHPSGSWAMDQAGNLFGTATEGGITGANCSDLGCGAIFKLTHTNSGWWLFTRPYIFHGDDGAGPNAVMFGPDGSLYGTTCCGGPSGGSGTISSCDLRRRLAEPRSARGARRCCIPSVEVRTARVPAGSSSTRPATCTEALGSAAMILVRPDLAAALCTS